MVIFNRNGLTRLMLYASILILIFLPACGGNQERDTGVRVDSTDTRTKSLDALIEEADVLTRFNNALEITGVDDMLRSGGPFTVFAPSDEALSRSFSSIDTLFASENRDSLRKVVEYHIMRGTLWSSQVRDSMQISTLLERPVTIRRQREGQPLLVDGIQARAGVPAQNGMLYVLESIITLPEPDTTGIFPGEQVTPQ